MGSLIPDWCNDTILAQVKEAASADLCVDTFLHLCYTLFSFMVVKKIDTNFFDASVMICCNRAL